MKKLGLQWVIAGTLGVGTCGPPSRAAASDLPPLQAPAIVPQDLREGGIFHEAAVSTTPVPPPVAIEKAPPAPIVEGAGAIAPAAGAQWLEGYWDWDPSGKDFVWVSGIWRVPPPGRFWVKGYWKRGERGWYRARGFWSDRKADVQRDGPPPELRKDRIGPAPGPDYFFIPGQYVPSGDGVSWRPGFWARSQPGWEWVPARWVRLAEGWTYRAGHWERAASGLDPDRHIVARPPTTGLTSPFSTPAPAPAPVPAPPPPLNRSGDPNPTTDLAPLPDPGTLATPGPVPSPAPAPAPAPRGPQTIHPIPRVAVPGISPRVTLPITEVYLPNGLHVRVVPGQLPLIERIPLPYPGIVVPQVQVRPGLPLPGVPGTVRDPINGVLP